jgi:hypothetical protein
VSDKDDATPDQSEIPPVSIPTTPDPGPISPPLLSDPDLFIEVVRGIPPKHPQSRRT